MSTGLSSENKIFKTIQDYFTLYTIKSWPSNNTSFSRIQNAFKIARCIENMTKEAITTNNYDDFFLTCNLCLKNINMVIKLDKKMLETSSDFILVKFLHNSDLELDIIDCAINAYIEKCGQERFEKLLTHLILTASSYKVLNDSITSVKMNSIEMLDTEAYYYFSYWQDQGGQNIDNLRRKISTIFQGLDDEKIKLIMHMLKCKLTGTNSEIITTIILDEFVLKICNVTYLWGLILQHPNDLIDLACVYPKILTPVCEFLLRSRDLNPKQLIDTYNVSKEQKEHFLSMFLSNDLCANALKETEFYAEVGIGHPVKYFKLVVDTAWAETWVASKQCGLKCVGCWNLNKYDSLASSTFQENGKEFSFGSGKEAITGFFSIESFYIGHINVKNQTFGEVTCLPWHYLFSKADGVLGLAFSSLSIGNIMPIFYNMVYQQLIKKPIFSIYMNRDPTTNHAGSIMIGASNPKHYNGSWTYTSVTQKKYWQFNIDNIYLDLGTKSYSLCDSTCPSIIDSSTSIISGPSKIIKRINSLMSATELLMGYYQVDCGKVTKLPHVRFLIAGRNFTLHGKELAQKMEMKGVSACLSVFASTEFADQNNLWTLGSAFLAQYYTLYDINASKIGFATAT